MLKAKRSDPGQGGRQAEGCERSDARFGLKVAMRACRNRKIKRILPCRDVTKWKFWFLMFHGSGGQAHRARENSETITKLL